MNQNFLNVKEKIKKIDFPAFRVGDVVRVSRRVKEGAKERVQIIEGEIIAHKHGFEPGASITLRRMTLGVAVELVLPIYSPFTEKIEITRRRKVRKAKLYYLRQIKNKKSKLKENVVATKILREEEIKLKEKAKEAEKKIEKEKVEAKKEGGEK